MLRAAAELTRDLARAAAGDLLGRPDRLGRASAMPRWPAAMLRRRPAGRSLRGVVAVLALYRALQLHPRAHATSSTRALPGFRLGWNLLVGMPLLMPSFMYEGVHNLHHARTRYGTVGGSRISAARADEAVDAAAVHRSCRRWRRSRCCSAIARARRRCRCCRRGCARVVVERYSALSINPAFRRRAPEGESARAVAPDGNRARASGRSRSIALVATGVIPLARVR